MGTERWYILTPKGYRLSATEADTQVCSWDRLWREWYPGSGSDKAPWSWIEDMVEAGYLAVKREVETPVNE